MTVDALQIMIGRLLGRDALAAASIGNTWYNLMFYFQVMLQQCVSF